MKRTAVSLAVLLLGVALYLLGPDEGDRPGSGGDLTAPRSAPSAPAPAAPPVAVTAEERESDTQPAVNEAHVFEGEVNRRGKPVGFHSRPGGRNPPRARVVRIVDGPNRLGVYVAEVEIRNRSGRWLRKTSTFFPDRLRRDEVLAAIRRSYRDRTTGGSERFRGPSGKGFTVEGYTLDGGINTAYPIYVEGQ
jgi:hypothetical protein